MDLSRHMVLAGGQFQPVKGAIDEGGNDWFKGGPRKAVFGRGIRGKELSQAISLSLNQIMMQLKTNNKLFTFHSS